MIYIGRKNEEIFGHSRKMELKWWFCLLMQCIWNLSASLFDPSPTTKTMPNALLYYPRWQMINLKIAQEVHL